MKNNLLKYYIVAVYLCSTFIMFAQPGTGTDTGSGADPLESGDPAAPIDDYVLLLAIVGMLFVFMRFRAIKAKQIQRQNRLY